MRGRVIWVSDLGQFLGDTIAVNTDRTEIPVIAIEDQDTMLGLAVDRIVDMDWLDVEQLQMASNVADTMAPFLRGEWVLDQEQAKFLRLLDQVAILRSARWAA
jgi:twitching motility protein PilI